MISRMSEDFTAYTFEQFASFLDGLVLARELSKTLLSDTLVAIPFLILIYVYGLFWWSKRVRSIADLAHFLLWFVVLTLFFSYLRTPMRVSVSFIPVYTYDATGAEDWMPIALVPRTATTTSAGSTLIFSIPDKLANFFYNFVLVRLRFSDTSPVSFEVGKCIDPDAVYAAGIVRGFRDFMGGSYSSFKDVNEFTETVERCTSLLGKSIFYDPTTDSLRVPRKMRGGVPLECERFVQELIDGIKEVINYCSSKMGEKFDAEAFRKGIPLCFSKSQACMSLLERTVLLARQLDDVVWGTPLEGLNTFPIAQDAVQNTVTDLADTATNFYLSYKTKWMTTLKVQGVLLGILIGLSPLLFIVSMIPTGNSAVNFRLFFIALFVYFLIKLWVPFLYLVHYFAYHTLSFRGVF